MSFWNNFYFVFSWISILALEHDDDDDDDDDDEDDDNLGWLIFLPPTLGDEGKHRDFKSTNIREWTRSPIWKGHI